MFMSKIIYNGKEYPRSVPYKELEGTLTAGQTSITFTDSVINSKVPQWSSIALPNGKNYLAIGTNALVEVEPTT